MALLQTTRKPVTVFRSTDNDAPELSNAAGSLRTLLEACLVTGYGGKQALGWEMPFSDSNNAAFKSKSPDATGCYLQIKNSGGRYARFDGFKTMTALEAGQGAFGLKQNFCFLRASEKPAWLLVGHDRAFWLFIHQTYRSSDNGSNWFFFGDFPSYAPQDQGNCALGHFPFGSSTYLATDIRPPSTLAQTGNIFACRSANQQSSNAELRLNSRCLNFSGQAYPDLITGGFLADRIDLHEDVSYTSRRALRGKLPGLYACAHDLRSFSEGVELSEGLDNTEDKFAKLNLLDSTSEYSNGHFLLNLTAWLG